MPLIRYNLSWPAGWSDLRIERWCFLHNHGPDKGGLGRFEHFRKASQLIWPNLIWHDWAIEKLRSLCDVENAQVVGDVRIWNVSWIGCGTSAKTFDSSHFALNWWLMDPGETIVILCSTTVKMVRRRTWTEIKKLWNSSGEEGMSGHIIPTEYAIHAVDPENPQQTDERHTIHCIAVKGGKLEDAIADIQGQHARRIMIVIDEAPATPQAIYETIPNLRKGCQELIVVSSGNPVTRRMDPHGIVSEPLGGWPSVSRYSHRWKTKPVKKWQLPSGVCIHFPGRESPNVKAGKTIYPFLYTWEDHQNAIELKGEKDLSYWKYDEAFYAPDDIGHTVYSETVIQAYDGMGTLKFTKPPIKVSALDPAWGGDSCIQLFGLLGEMETNRRGLQLTEWTEIKLVVGSPDSKDMQIYKAAMANCQTRGILPAHFALDRTGNGQGIFSYLCDFWSPDVHPVDFGGGASERESALYDRRPANEVYDRRVTELWFGGLELLKGHQIGGMYPELIVELCGREYKEIDGQKKKINTKQEVKKHLGFSPDHGDAFAVLVDLAFALGATPEGVGYREKGANSWLDTARKFNSIYQPDNGPRRPMKQRLNPVYRSSHHEMVGS